MTVIGVNRAAEELGVSSRRVRQMLADGDLQGERVGRAWVIERPAIEDLMNRRPEVGRPWRAEAAWALLALANGQEIDVSPVDRNRIQRRLDDGVEAHVGRLRVRAAERRLYAHPSVLDSILSSARVVRSGVSAGVEYSIDLISNGEAEGYVRLSDLDGLIEQFAVDESSDRPNLLLRVVDDNIWPFNDSHSVAPRVVVAVDLMGSSDERSRRAGRELLARA